MGAARDRLDPRPPGEVADGAAQLGHRQHQVVELGCHDGILTSRPLCRPPVPLGVLCGVSALMALSVAAAGRDRVIA
ncbi:hypothetical protein GCM10011509_17720 [Ornithinimicrobium pekingense]|uniref:Uncharacterized protein n=1 Tax=Ornithinimicrobium pekingense TaxID=384677 RepID=A0ABQ2F7Z2_9MICO|nr:hypothetical protein GCM10011509_17720 [Ornithinimicrobium pekingense]